jgi:hypothetical protein
VNGTALAGWSSNVYANVPVTDGLYSVLLEGLPVAGMDGARWLGVTVDGGTEIAPRTRLGSVPFALNAQTAQEVAWSGVTGLPQGFSDNADDVGTGVPGSGAAGRVSVWDSTTSVSGSTGLLYANNTLTVTGDVAYTGSLVRNGTPGYTYVPLASPLGTTSYDGNDTLAVGTTTLNAVTTWGVPSGAKVIYARILCKWAAASAASTASVLPAANTNFIAKLTAHSTNEQETTVLIPLDANGAWRIAVANATANNVKIVIWGYGL